MRWNKGNILKAAVEHIRKLHTRQERQVRSDDRAKKMEAMNRQLMIRLQECENAMRSNGLDVPDMPERDEFIAQLGGNGKELGSKRTLRNSIPRNWKYARWWLGERTFSRRHHEPQRRSTIDAQYAKPELHVLASPHWWIRAQANARPALNASTTELLESGSSPQYPTCFFLHQHRLDNSF